MKKNRLLLIVLALLMLIPTGAFAKKGKKGGNGGGGIMIQGGLDLGLNIPMLSLYELGCESEVLLSDAEYNLLPWQRTVWVQFGGKIGGDFGLSYVTKKNRGFGFILNVAYNVAGGLHGYTGGRAIGGIHYESIGEDTRQAIISHSILVDINFSFKSKMDKTANFAAELGLRLMPTFDHAYMLDNHWEKINNSDVTHWYFYLGPNVFFGADVRVGEHFMITPGFRFAGTFASDFDQDYDERRDYKRWKIRTKLMFAFEIKLNGYYKK